MATINHLAKCLLPALLATLVLGACGGSPPPTATVAPSPTMTEAVGSSATAYKHHAGDKGNWSIDYPATWTANVNESTTQFSELNGGEQAYVQLTYTEVVSKLLTSSLANMASNSLQKTYRDYSYLEVRDMQPNGGSRIDFTFTKDGSEYTGYTLTNQRGTGVYMLTLVAQKAQSGKYDSIFKKMADSYTLPPDNVDE